MKKIFYCFIGTLLLYSCKRDVPGSHDILIHATFTDVKGTPVKEAAAGQTLIISAEEFANIVPQGSLKDLKLFFNDVPVEFQQVGPTALSLKFPLMLMSNYANIFISMRYKSSIIRLIEYILYRPTVTAEVFAGHDGTFLMPAEMTIDAAGNVYVIDQQTATTPNHDVIFKITPAGASSLYAGSADEFGKLVGIGIDPLTSKMYVADASAQQVKSFDLAAPAAVSVLAGSGVTGNADGTGLAASFTFGDERVNNFGVNERGQGLAVDAAGNVYVGEKYGTSFGGGLSQVRKITPAGVVTTVAGSSITTATSDSSFDSPAGLTILPTGEVVYIGGASGLFQGLTRVTTAGTMDRFAGRVSFEVLNDGLGSVAAFTYPKAISYFNGYYHVADGSNGAYRRVTPAGDVITLAGVGHFATPMFCSCPITGPVSSSYVFPSIFDGNPDRFEILASAIVMDQVGGIAVRNNGLIYLSDYGGSFKCVWKIRIE
jgi:hypothetical protein